MYGIQALIRISWSSLADSGWRTMVSKLSLGKNYDSVGKHNTSCTGNNSSGIGIIA